MMNIADFHVATIRDGAYDPYREDESLSVVYHDQRKYYYDLSDQRVTTYEFESFVSGAFGEDVRATVRQDDVSLMVWVS